MENTITLPGENRHYIFITVTLLIFLAAMAYSFYISHVMVNKYAPLIDATMEIKLEATTAHLWLEEKLSGDRYEEFDKIIGHIDEAIWYARAMLEGDKNQEGEFIPLKDQNLRDEVNKTLNKLKEFKAITFSRYKAIEFSGIGTNIDQQYDKLFTSFITRIDQVETLLQQKIRHDFSRYHFIQILLLSCFFLLGLATLYVQYRHDRAKKQAIQELYEARIKAEENENLLKTTMNSMGDGVIITDHQGRVTYLNPVASSLTGWLLKDARNKKMTEVFNIVNEYTKKPVQDPVEMVIRKNVVVGLANHTELIARDGTAWPIADSAAPIYDKEDNLLGVVVVFHEISAQKKAESEKAMLESQLRQSYKMEAIGTMAGGIAHDFNNVLAIILGSADMALDDITPDNTPARHNIEQVLVAANRAKELVKQILSFSRQEPQKKEPMYLCRLVEESMKSLRSTIPTSVKLTVNVPELCHKDISRCPRALVDPTQVHQLLMNLTVNAVQAMDEKGELTISVTDVSYDDDIPPDRAGLQPGTYLLLCFMDTGSGIDPEDIEQVFDPFFTTKQVGEGTGMGLSVVHGIIEGHDGKIYVESEPGTGTTFHMYFPVTDQQPRQQGMDTRPLPTGNEHILFVDDEVSLAEMGSKMIERLGYTVTVMTDSLQALELYEKNPDRFDLVITDQTMPNMTGAELAEDLLRMKPDLPIIICTGYSSKIDKKSVKKLGINAFAAKPLDRSEMAVLIRKVLDDTNPE